MFFSSYRSRADGESRGGGHFALSRGFAGSAVNKMLALDISLSAEIGQSPKIESRRVHTFIWY